MFKRILLLLACSLLILNAFDSYTAPITRHKITKNMAIYNFWSREYPKPVIYIKPTKNGWLRIRGYPSVRHLDKKVSCLVKTGLYHPWSEDNTSVKEFYTLAPKISYIALRDTTIGDGKIKIKKNDILENEAYLAEGECYYIFNKTKRITTYCLDEDNRDFKRVKEPSFPTEQWLYLECREGYNIFVQDKDLLKQKGVTEGVIKGYGRVSSK